MGLFYMIPFLIVILGTDICYLARENDLESRKIYIVTLIIGFLILLSVLFKLFF